MIVITVMSRKTDIKVDTVCHINHAVVVRGLQHYSKRQSQQIWVFLTDYVASVL